MPVDIYQSLWAEFAVESAEHLERVEPLLVAIEAAGAPDPATAETVATLFRGVHSVKGMAAALALRGMERVAHHAEHLLGEVRDGRCALDGPMAGMLLQALDELKRLRELSLESHADSPASESVMARLEAARGALEGAPKREEVLDFAAALAAAQGAAAIVDEGPPPLHPDRALLNEFMTAVRPRLPDLALLVGPDLEASPTRQAVRRALEEVRAGAERLEFTQVVRTAELLTALIPFEGCLDYYAREQAIDALADLRREIATIEAATGGDGGGDGLDQALTRLLSLDFTARRRALLDLLGRFDAEPAAFAAGGAAVGRAAEMAGDIYNHFSFLHNANAGRLLLMIEDVLGHAGRGDIALTPDLLGLMRKTLAGMAPAPGQPLRDIPTGDADGAMTEFQRVIREASGLTPPAGVPEDETVVAGRQYLAELGVTRDLLDRLSGLQVREAAEQVVGGDHRLWEIVASLEEAEDKADRFAAWLEGSARVLTSRAMPGTTALSFQFLVLTALDETQVLAALAGIDPEGRTLTARRLGASLFPPPPFEAEVPAPEPPPTPSPSPAPTSSSLTAPPPTEGRGVDLPRATATAGGSNMLRVPGEVVDNFLSMIGEMVMVSGMIDDAVWGDDRRARLPLDLRRLAKDMRAHGGADPTHLDALQRCAAGHDGRNRSLRKARDRLAATLGRLQEAALELRVVPVEQVFGRLPRLARDLASSHGKQVRVEIDGRGVRIDKGMVDQLLDPLIHMVRNAIDHGVETPAERVAAGKPPVATLSVCADQRDNRVVIEITDDGRGLDAEAIRARAVERQLVGEATSRLLRDADLFRMILQPGFSTADVVTETSGRGVGMDVVHTNVTRMGGAIDIGSRPGQGATFTLRLPLSAAIQDVLLVEADGRLHAIPVRHLLELCGVAARDIQIVHGQPAILLHGALLPVHRLTSLLDGRPGTLPGADLPVVVLGDGRRRLGLQVDRVVRRQELFVRDIHPRIAAIPGIGGAALLGDGKVVLIVDAGELFQLAHARENGPPAARPRLEAPP